ncbi:MAG: 23S rRNA (uracil(1939)-C(5))-methyltransferase RlmD [Clostridia bacterium]|nr:23S rRNA (uracil(1939)-C(5))-methyltransferase RlmD [Clostridia bacterium]
MENSLKKNEEYEVEILDLGINGEGIAKINGQVVFVPFALPGEIVKILIINTKSKIAVGKVIEIIKPSEDRVNPVCPYFKKCGGCALQHLDYNKQLEFKTNLVKNNLKNIGKIEKDINMCVSSQAYQYRNKCSIPVVDINGETIIGMFRENSHKVVPIEKCAICGDYIEKIIKIMQNYIKLNNIQGYNEEKNIGLLRHIVCRKLNNQIIITLVLTKNFLPNSDYLINRFKSEFKNFSLWININKKPTNVILGDEFKLVYGENAQTDIMGLKVSVSPASFMQVNDEIRDKIYNRATEAISSEKIVIDVYSGAGVMTGITSKKSKHSYGLEIVKEAVKDADNLAKINGIKNMTNICGDASITLPKLVEKLDKSCVEIILDPPRKGCSKEVLDAVLKVAPSKIIYISCNSATLARDLKILFEQSNDYEIEEVSPFDMFPQTAHVETMVIIKRK